MSDQIIEQPDAQSLQRFQPPSKPAVSARFSKYLPKGLRERYEEFYESPDYISLRDQIAIADMHFAELIERRECEGTSPEGFKTALSTLNGLINDFEWGNPEEWDPSDYLDAIGRLEWLQRYFMAEARRDELRNEINKQQLILDKMKATEVKRMVAANQVLTVTESYNLIQRLASIIEEYIEDEYTRSMAVRELHKLLNRK